jgi:glutamate-1-semialdehyde 2,1-aminomutase
MRVAKSRKLFARASRILPGGVDSPVRAFKAVGGGPLFIRRASGSTIEDVDGNTFIDYVMSWGPLIHGHAPRGLIKALAAAAKNGTSFGAPSPLEVELGARVSALMPSIERVRFVNSGTEATMSAVRVARAATGRERIIKFEGCYHGHADPFLVQAGSGALTLGVPTSPGVTRASVADTLVAGYNDADSVRRVFDANRGTIAAVIVEPIAGNMGVVPPAPGFLQVLRELCDAAGALLVFDEVITGFRVARGGAQELYGVIPDLTILGKILGGGLPLAAFGGRADVMSELAPSGPVYQAGTLSGNPLATAAGVTVLRRLRDPAVYERLEASAARLEQGLAPFGVVQRVGAMLTLFDRPVRNYDDARACDTERYAALFRHLLERGVYVAPSQFEAMFVSLAHTDADVDATVEAVADYFRN